MNWEHLSVTATAAGVILGVLGWLWNLLRTMRSNDLTHMDEKLDGIKAQITSLHEDVKDVRLGLAAHIAYHLEHK